MKNVTLKQSFKAYNMMVFFTTLISILIIFSGFTYVKGAVEQAQLPKQPQDAIDISYIERIEGIAWDGKYLLALDGEEKKIYWINSISGQLVKPPLVLDQNLFLDQNRLKGLAFQDVDGDDGKALWIAVANEGKEAQLIMVDPVNGNIKKTIEMQIPINKGFDSIEGIAWDGKRKCIWVAIYAGFSSSFNQINPETGKIIRSIFADCHPRGIATDGKYLWSICYNGQIFPSKIDKRKIEDKEHEMLRSRTFIKDIDKEAEPASLVFDDKDLWYADRETKRIFKVTPPSIKPIKQPVKGK